MRLPALLIVTVAFSAWSISVVVEHGYLGFLPLATAGGWSSQVFVDLLLALSMLLGFMHGDSRRSGTPFWPYAVATPLLGSIGPLAYLVHREFRRRAAEPVGPATG